MLIPNMLLLLTEDQLIRSKLSKYLCKMSMKSSEHIPANLLRPNIWHYFQGLSPEKIKMGDFVFFFQNIDKEILKMMNFFVIFLS